jgi:hypothetical protein
MGQSALKYRTAGRVVSSVPVNGPGGAWPSSPPVSTVATCLLESRSQLVAKWRGLTDTLTLRVGIRFVSPRPAPGTPPLLHQSKLAGNGRPPGSLGPRRSTDRRSPSRTGGVSDRARRTGPVERSRIEDGVLRLGGAPEMVVGVRAGPLWSLPLCRRRGAPPAWAGHADLAHSVLEPAVPVEPETVLAVEGLRSWLGSTTHKEADASGSSTAFSSADPVTGAVVGRRHINQIRLAIQSLSGS